VRRLLILAAGIFLIAPQIAQACTINWTGKAGDHYWTTAGNWDTNQIPGPTDNVCIGSGFVVNTVDGKTIGTILSLTLDGSLTLNDVSTVLTDTSATSTIYNLTLNGPNSQTGLTVNNANVNFTGTLTLSNGAVMGPAVATIKGEVKALKDNCYLAPYYVDNQGTIMVSGSVQLTLGTVSFENDSTGLIDLQGDGIKILTSGTLDNLGSITKSMGTGTSTFSTSGAFNNAGKIGAQSGILQLATFFTNNGAFSASSGATLQFANIVTLNEGTAFDGSGTMDIAPGGVWDVEALVTVETTNLAFDGGQATIIRGNSNLTINSTTVTWNSGLLGAQTGSKMSLPNGKTMNIVTSGYHGLAMNLDLSGTVNMKADLQLSEPTITIEPEAHFYILTDNGIHGGGNIYNGGSFQKTGGTGYSDIDYSGTFNILPKDSYPVQVKEGYLVFLSLSGVLGGTWIVNSAANVEFEGGNYTLPAGSKFIGGGDIFLIGANWDLTGDVSVDTDSFAETSGSTISGAFDLTLLSKVIKLGGTRTGVIQAKTPAGTIKIPDAASQVTVFATLTLDGCTLENSSEHFVINQNYSVVVQDSAVLLNEPGGIIYLAVPAGTTPAIQLMSGTFSNLGTVTLGPKGAATQTIAGGAWSNSGNLVVPQGFTLSIPGGYVNLGGAKTINGGTIILEGLMDLEGGTLGGAGIVSGSASIKQTGATIEAGTPTKTGILGLNVPLTQGPGAATAVQMNGTKAGTQYDQILSTSSVALGGTLDLQFGNGFSPSPTNSFAILSFASSTDSFASVVTPSSTGAAKLTTTSTSLSVAFTSSSVAVTIAPPSVTLAENAQEQFTDTVTNGCGNGVTWKVKEGAAGGTITTAGLYTAPAATGTFHVVVTSVAAPGKSATSTVTVTAAAGKDLSVTPRAAAVSPGGSVHFAASQSVTWSVAEGTAGGSISASGIYTAAQKPGLYHVVASGNADAANHAIVNIAVVAGNLKSVYVANIEKNLISVLTASNSSGQATGPLRATQSVATGHSPVALAISSQGSLLVANRDSNDVSAFALPPASATLQSVAGPEFESGTGPSALAWDPSGRLAFVTDSGSDEISLFSARQSAGQLAYVGKQDLGTGDKPSAIAVDPIAPFVFVANAGGNTLDGFTYDLAGTLSTISGSPFAVGKGPAAIAIDPAGKFLFVANRGSGDVSVFVIDAPNETVHEVAGSPFPAGKEPAALVTDATGSYIFVANHRSNTVSSFLIDSETGALTPLGQTLPAIQGPTALAADPSGRYLFVVNDTTGGVLRLTLNVATGALTPTDLTTGPGKASAIVLLGDRNAQAP